MTKLLREKNVLFLHIPRTGGTWVESALDVCKIRSTRWSRIAPYVDRLPKNHLFLSHHRTSIADVKGIFCFVRHPLTYYESVYKFICRAHKMRIWKWSPFFSAEICYNTVKGDWNRWLIEMMKDEPAWYTRLIEGYVGPKEGEFVHFIGRQENLVEDFLSAMKYFGYQDVDQYRKKLFALEHVHKIDQPLKWDPNVQAQIEQMENSVIKRFYQGKNSRRLHYLDMEESLS
jgi:hypothetical protein